MDSDSSEDNGVGHMRKRNHPRWIRDFKDHAIGWEIYSLHHWFINIAVGMFEIQLNKWPKTTRKGK